MFTGEMTRRMEIKKGEWIVHVDSFSGCSWEWSRTYNMSINGVGLWGGQLIARKRVDRALGVAVICIDISRQRQDRFKKKFREK